MPKLDTGSSSDQHKYLSHAEAAKARRRSSAASLAIWKGQLAAKEMLEREFASHAIREFLITYLEMDNIHLTKIKMMRSGKFVATMSGPIDVMAMPQSFHLAKERPWLDITLRRIFASYCGHRQTASSDFSVVMSISDWYNFLHDCQLLGPVISRGAATVCFYGVLGRQHSHDKNMSYTEFRWVLRDLSALVYGPEDVTEAMRKLLKSHILLFAKRMAVGQTLVLMPHVRKEFVKVDATFRRVFLHYSNLEVVETFDKGEKKWEDNVAQDETISQPEFIIFAQNFDIIPAVTLYEVCSIFREVSLMYPSVGGDTCVEYEGFLEVVARLALRIARKDAEQLAPTSKQVVAEKRAAYKLTNYTDAALATVYDNVCDGLFDEI